MPRKRVSRPARIALSETSSRPAPITNGARRRRSALAVASSESPPTSVAVVHRPRAVEVASRPRHAVPIAVTTTRCPATARRRPSSRRPRRAVNSGRRARVATARNVTAQASANQRERRGRPTGADEPDASGRRELRTRGVSWLGCAPIGPSPSALPSDSRKPDRGASRSAGTHHRKPREREDAGRDRGHGRRAGADAPPRRAAALDLGDRGHGAKILGRAAVRRAAERACATSRSPIRRGGSGSIWLRPATRDTRSPANRTTSSTGAARRDQRLDPALQRELPGGAMRHGARL